MLGRRLSAWELVLRISYRDSRLSQHVDRARQIGGAGNDRTRSIFEHYADIRIVLQANLNDGLHVRRPLPSLLRRVRLPPFGA